MKKILKADLNDKRIVDKCDKIFYIHKDESIKADTYIEYLVVYTVPKNYAGDLFKNYESLIQVDIFSKGNYESLADTMLNVLLEKDYLLQEIDEDYESDTKLYHYIAKFKKYTIKK